MSSLENKGNILGDVRAENDKAMLQVAFYDWQDHKILSEASDRFIVVGRRGTGKSALTYKLTEDWRAQKDFVVVVAPDEEDVIGLRGTATRFGTTLTRIRSAIKTGWRYALVMEIASKIVNHYKFEKAVSDSKLLGPAARRWEHMGGSIISRLKKILQASIVEGESAEESISELSARLRVNEVTAELEHILLSAHRRVMVLIDRLDEGYEPDEVGVGIVDGIIYGSDELRNRVDSVRTFLFLRDNVFRAIQTYDQDFTRNVEGSVLRLHWDVQELFHLVCMRLRVAFKLDVESNVRVWNSVTANELHGMQGFKNVLRLTLYRPRDLISLLNTAFYNASKASRKHLILDDLSASASHISEIRFDDLRKEYSSVFPGILEITRNLAANGAQFSVAQAEHTLTVLRETTVDPVLTQHFLLLGATEEILKSLYGIGFIGIIDKLSGNAVFSHDGKKPDKLFDPGSLLLIHPCYRAALGIFTSDMDQSAAEEIYDEYDITISSEVKEQRNKSIGRLISELDSIDKGVEDAAMFEDWVKRALDLIVARKLQNVQLKPNGNAPARRDIVGTNMAVDGFWRRIREDYQSRQVIFEVKNYEKMGIEEYRQCSSYLGQEYGKIAFLVCRDSQKELSKGGEIEAFREFYNRHGHMVVKLTAHFLSSLISKLRSPQKYDQIDEALTKHLDAHIRMYAQGQGGVERPSKKKRGKSS